MNYVRKRKRDPQDVSGGGAPSPSTTHHHPPQPFQPPRPQQPPMVKRKRPAMFGPGSGIPPPDSMSGNNGNQLRLVCMLVNIVV